MVVGDLRLDIAEVCSDVSDVFGEGLPSVLFVFDLFFQFLNLHLCLLSICCGLSTVDFSLKSLQFVSFFSNLVVENVDSWGEDILGDIFGIV